jgi:uncharacterized damage-inducible protein DinB
MKNEMIWFDRKFVFNLAIEMFPMVVERLRGCPARLEEKVKPLSSEILTRKEGDRWSIQETVGHLLVVEELWHGRFDDFMAGKKDLRPADIENRRTKESDFHSFDINELLKSFRDKRKKLVDNLYGLNDEQVALTAQHPRLDQPMRLIDSYYFAAEHDDHHLARITDMINRQQGFD